MRVNIFLVLIMESTVCFAATTICPAPVVDDIGVLYHTQERFDKIRKGNNKLTTKYVHHRHVDDKDGEEYKYIVTFCGENNGTAVVQIDGKTDKERIIGRFDNAAVLIGADDWLLVQYFHGENYSSHCNNTQKQSWISITCEDQGRKSQLRVIEEARFLNHDSKKHRDTICYFLFEYNHPAACSTTKPKSLSGGAIICIIIIVLLSSYLILGFIYQRFVKGATGIQQIPHSSFWTEFGNTMADGCDFVCRREVETNIYKGLTEDDMHVESSDDDHNGLLPM